MQKQRNLKRITWAPDVNLCQVRLFLSEESPSQVGHSIQDHLQAKKSCVSHSTEMGGDDTLPPGFEQAHPSNQWQIQPSQIPLVKWRRPVKFELDSSWEVAAGEESIEVEDENRREMRVLEAVYPRASSIPPNPTVSMEVENVQLDDQQTPLVPMTATEDEDQEVDAPSESMGSFDFAPSSQSSLMPSSSQSSLSHANASCIPKPPASEETATDVLAGVDPGIAAAASAAYAAVMKNNEQGNLIDPDLLMQILSSPQLIEKLVTEYGAARNRENIPIPVSSQVLSSPLLSQMIRTEPSKQLSAAPSVGPYYSQPYRPAVGSTPSPSLPLPAPVRSPPPIVAPLTKDINYYKSLIQQHGEERQEALPQFRNRHNQSVMAAVHQHQPRPTDHKPKIMKPCLYFNTSRGCRNGNNCSFLHDASFKEGSNGVPDMQSSKRMKMDR